MNNEDISAYKQGNAASNNASSKNATTETHPSKDKSNSVYIDPFYTPPGEGPKPRITSN